MNTSVTDPPSLKRTNTWQVAWQSAFAAALCLGLPAGVTLWLMLFQRIFQSIVINDWVAFIQSSRLNSIFVLALCSLMWSYLLGGISHYRRWWKIGLATVVAILFGWFSPLSNLDSVFGDQQLPVHMLYAIAMSGIIGVVTFCVGLAYGLILPSIKAMLSLAFTTSFVSVLTLLLTILLFDQFGIRVGTGNFAMTKVTLTSLLTSAVTGGAMLGVGFSRFVKEKQAQIQVSTQIETSLHRISDN
jgi:hypothetical protein